MNKILLLGILCIIGTHAYAQNILNENLEWKVNSYFEVQTGMSFEEVGSLITQTNHQIEWHAWDGTLKQAFQVEDTKGNWNNVEDFGSITYIVNSGEHRGSIAIERSANGLIARIMLVENEEPIVYELLLNGVQKL